MPRFTGSSQKDDTTLQGGLQIQATPRREPMPVRRRVHTGDDPLPSRRDKGIGTRRQIHQVGVFKATPDFGLPTPVVILDHGLKARLPRRDKDRHDVQEQAQAGDPTEAVRPLIAP